MASYRSSYVRCPYYIDDTRNSIQCEGIGCADKTTSGFVSSRDCTEFFEVYCCNYCEDCPIYKIINDKYE